jgi:hypothetical protein
VEGALEGVSYLSSLALLTASVCQKIKTGEGLFSGRSEAGMRFLGLAEGLSYVSVLAGIAVAAANIGDFGFPHDNARCTAEYAVLYLAMK